MTRRTGAEEVAVFKKRCEDLFEKEARCLACLKARRDLPPEAPQAPCSAHMRVRREMGLGGPNWR